MTRKFDVFLFEINSNNFTMILNSSLIFLNRIDENNDKSLGVAHLFAVRYAQLTSCLITASHFNMNVEVAIQALQRENREA